MPPLIEVTLERCERPLDDVIATLEVPYRPFPDGNGWFAHYFYHPGGVPAFKRLTHGDHADLWYRVLGGESPSATD